MWNSLLVILLIYTATVMPYRLAFKETVYYDGFTILDLVVDSLFFTDILVNFVSPYYDADNQLILDWG